MLLCAQPVQAMSWSWSPLGQGGAAPTASGGNAAGERLSITLDNPGQVRRLVRSGTNTLLLLLDGDTPVLQRQGAAPAAGALLESVGMSNGQVRITLSSRAMSHVMRRPSASVLDIEIFAAGLQGDTAARQDAQALAAGDTAAPGAAEQASSLGDSLPIDAGKDFLHTALKMLDNAQQNVLSLSPSDLLDTAKNRLTGLLPLSVFSAADSAIAAEVPRQAAQGETNQIQAPQGPSLMSRINPGGPEDWPEDKGLFTTVPSRAAPVAATQTAAPSAQATPPAAAQPVTQPVAQPVTQPAAPARIAEYPATESATSPQFYFLPPSFHITT